MPRESLKAKQERALIVCERMAEHYPDPKPQLEFGNDPFRLAIAVMLSAQTTDASVNKVTPLLWEKYPTVADLASARLSDVEEILHPLGFFRSKANNAIRTAQIVLTEYDGEVPKDIDEMQKLPGIGRKSANIVTSVAFGDVSGIAVDTHVFRIAHRLGFSKAKDPSGTEKDLLKVIPEEFWGGVNIRWILFGRETCTARKPKCDSCFLADICPSFENC